MSTHDDVRAEIEALAAASGAAMAKNDLGAVLATMTDDVVLLSAAGLPVNVAVVFGTDSARMTPVGGGPTMVVSGPAVSVFRREDGRWKLARSLNLMAPVNPPL